VKEWPADSDKPVVQAYYKDAGHPEVRHDSVPWCAAFVSAMLARAGSNLRARLQLAHI
jgi:hypothetical protein